MSEQPHVIVQLIPTDPPRPGWRKNPATSEEFYSAAWLSKDDPELALENERRLYDHGPTRPLVVAGGTRSAATDGYPTTEDQLCWARKFVADAWFALARKLDQLREISPEEDQRRLTELRDYARDQGEAWTKA